MDTSYSDEVKNNTPSQQLLQKIQYLHPNLIQDAQLTKMAQSLTAQIRRRDITSLHQAENWIKNQRFESNNLKQITVVYNPDNKSLTPIEYFFAKTEFNKISENTLLNRIGVSVRPLKSKKVIFAVIFAEVNEKQTNNKIKSIIEQFSGRIKIRDPNSLEESIKLSVIELINSFRSNFNIPKIDFNNDILNDTNGSEEIIISVQKDHDILLSCLMDQSFVQFMFSSINFITTKVEDLEESNKLKITFKGKRTSKQVHSTELGLLSNESEENSTEQSEIQEKKANLSNIPEQTTGTSQIQQTAENPTLSHQTDELNENNLPINQDNPLEAFQSPIDRSEGGHIQDNQFKELTDENSEIEKKPISTEDNSTSQEGNEYSTEDKLEQKKTEHIKTESKEEKLPDAQSVPDEQPEKFESTINESKEEDKQQSHLSTDIAEIDNSINQPSQPILTEEQSQSTKTETPSQSASTRESTQNGSTDDSTQNASTKEPVQNASTGETAQPISTAESTQDASTEKSTQHVSVESTQHVSTGESAQSVSTREPKQNASTEESTKQDSTEESGQSISTGEPIQSVSAEELGQSVSTGEPIQPVSTEESIKPVSTEESIKPVSTEESIKPVSTEETLQLTEKQERHIKIDKNPRINSASSESFDPTLPDSPRSILTTPKKGDSPRDGQFRNEDDELVNTRFTPNKKTDSINTHANETAKTNKPTEDTNSNLTDNNNAIRNENDNDNNNNNTNDGGEINIINPTKIDLDSPCTDPSELTQRALIVFNDVNGTASTEKPNTEMCDRLSHLMDDHQKDFQKSITPITIRSLFDEDVKEYKRGFVVYDKDWKEIRKEIEKMTKKYANQSKEHIIFAIASTIQKGTAKSNPKFNLCYVTKATEISSSNSRNFSQAELTLTPNPKMTQSQNVQNTPIKQISSESIKSLSKTPDVNQKQSSTSIPSRYKEMSEKLEYEIKTYLQSLKKSKQFTFNNEISDRIRQELTNNRGKSWDNKEVKEMFINEIDHPWARVYFNLGYEDSLKKVKNEYKNLFSKQIFLASILIVAAISEDESTNTFTAIVVTGQPKTNNNNNNGNSNSNTNTNQTNETSNNPPAQLNQVSNLNLKDTVNISASTSNASFNSSGNQSANQSGSATPRNSGNKRKKRTIGDFERSRLFLECFNNYRQRVGKKNLEFNDALIGPAKDLSRTIMKNFSMVDTKEFIDQAYKVQGVENVKACANFDSKSGDYVTRMFEQMLVKYKDVIESDNDKIAIGYWNDENRNVSVACFLFRFKTQ